ncbi:MAG: V/A-type H+/Na+-transporting ATPase subunit [Archaeoglobi archaeon]|nr:V/A-type H+/Na+-transporting ATPase subunit [Archaeoglobi archaeon]
MSLERVIEDTLKKSRERAEEIRRSAEEERKRIIEEAERRAAEIKEKKRREAEETAKRMRIQELSSARIEAKRRLLKLQKELIEKCYQEALKAISELPEERRERILERLISEAEKESERIYSNKKEEEIVRKLAKVEYGGNIDCAGGVIGENSDGSVRIDLRYETIFSSLFENSMKEIKSMLFGEK